MASSGDIPALVGRLRSPQLLEQEQAADALARVLAGDAATVQSLLAAGGAAALPHLLVSGSSQAGQLSAARALNAMQTLKSSQAEHLAQQLAEEAAGSLPALLALLHGSESELQEAAAFTIYKVVCSSLEMQSAVADAGGLTALLACLRAGLGNEQEWDYCLGYCALALGTLCLSSLEVRRAVAAAGSAAVLVPLLASCSQFAQYGAAQALQWLAEGCPEGQQAAAAAGAIPALAQLLASSTTARTKAAATHALLALRQHWSADVQQVAGSIPGLMHILQQSSNGSNQHAAFDILHSSYEFGGLPELRAMAAAGAAPALQRFLTVSTVSKEDEAAAELVSKASELLDALHHLPDR